MANFAKPGAVGHRGGDADDALVARRDRDQRVGERLRERRARRSSSRVLPFSGRIEFGPTPWNVRASLSAGSKPLPLTVRTCSSTGPGILRAFEMMSTQRVVVVAVDRADVAEAHLLEDDGRSCASGETNFIAAVSPVESAARAVVAERHVAEHVFRQFARAGRPAASSAAPTRYEAIEPTLGAIDISLSLRITMKLVFIGPALLIAS